VKKNYNIDILSVKVNGDPIEFITIRDEEYMENPSDWTIEEQNTILNYHIPTIGIIRNFPEDTSEIIITVNNTDYIMNIPPIDNRFTGKKCLTTIQANEVRLIESWIEWHKRLGFECFFIYDNQFGGTDAYDELFEKYPNELFVYNADFPFFFDDSQIIRIGQTIQQCHTLWKFSPEFLGLTDLDEYIYPTGTGNLSLFDPAVSVLSLPSYWFGCNKRAKFSPKNFTQALIKRKATGDIRNHRKCIVKSAEVDLACVHTCLNYSGVYKRATYDEVYLRHYFILSSRKRVCDCSVYCQVTDESAVIFNVK